MNLEAMSLPLRGVVLLPQPGEPASAEPALRELTSAIRRGDEQAFTRFHDLYSLRLYKYLLVLAKGNDSEAREVLQTVVVKLARKMEVFEEERRLWAWMCRLARNAFVDRCRSRRTALHRDVGLQDPRARQPGVFLRWWRWRAFAPHGFRGSGRAQQ